MTQTPVPNHHAHYPGFTGVSGLMAALSMAVGRDEHARWAARLCGVGAGDVVVDIGCGPGAAARHAAGLGATVIGVDPAPVMLRVASLLTRRSRVRYLAGAAEALPVPDASASVVWSIAAVHHWADLDAGLRAASRVLRPAGRFLAIERLVSSEARGLAGHGWTDAQAEAFAGCCREHDFVDVRIERSTGRRGTAIGVLAIRE